jgi:hypothetical protein
MKLLTDMETEICLRALYPIIKAMEDGYDKGKVIKTYNKLANANGYRSYQAHAKAMDEAKVMNSLECAAL